MGTGAENPPPESLCGGLFVGHLCIVHVRAHIKTRTHTHTCKRARAHTHACKNCIHTSTCLSLRLGTYVCENAQCTCIVTHMNVFTNNWCTLWHAHTHMHMHIYIYGPALSLNLCTVVCSQRLNVHKNTNSWYQKHNLPPTILWRGVLEKRGGGVDVLSVKNGVFQSKYFRNMNTSAPEDQAIPTILWLECGHTAACCNTLQHSATRGKTHCNTLQHTLFCDGSLDNRGSTRTHFQNSVPYFFPKNIWTHIWISHATRVKEPCK